MPIRWGPLGLSPTVTVTNFGIDSNVFNDSVDPQQDFTLTATPRIQARLRGGRVLVGGLLSTGLVYYQKFDDQRSIDYAGQGRIDLDLGRFRPYAVAERLDTRDRLSLELDVRAPRVSTMVEAGGRVALGSIVGFRFDARQTTVKFEEGQSFDGVLLSRTLNSRTTLTEAGFEVSLTPLTTLTVMASSQQDRFEASPDRDSDAWKVMPSLRFEAPAIVEGTIGVGFRRLEGRNPALPDYSGVVFNGSLSHVIAERTKVSVSLARDVQYSFEVVEPYYVTTGVRIGLTQQVGDAIDVRGAASRDRLDYRAQFGGADLADQTDHAEPGAPRRRDRVDLVSAGVGYHVRANVRFGVDLEYVRRLSAREDRKYDRWRLVASASYGF